MSLIRRKSIEASESRKPARPLSAPSGKARADVGQRGKAGGDSTSTRKSYRPRFAPVTFSEEAGVRYLHFGTAWIQGAMRLRKPFWLELEYAQQMMAWMLWESAPRHIVQLGLGAAGLTKFCWQHFPCSQLTAVELNPDVIAAAHSMFKLPYPGEARPIPEDQPDKAVQATPPEGTFELLQGDALDFVTDLSRVGTIDILQVDLYDATARGPVLDTAMFYQGCRQILRPGGMMTINLFGDHDSYPKNIRRIREAFGKTQVISLPEVHQGNIVVLAFNTARPLPTLDTLPALLERAKQIQLQTGLPARAWVNALKQVLNESVTAV